MDLPHKDIPDDDFDLFLQRATEADAIDHLTGQMIHDEAQDIFDKACEISGYEIPVPGTLRYDEARQEIRSRYLQELAAALLVEGYNDGDEKKIKQMIEDDLDSDTAFVFSAEGAASRMAIDLIEHLKNMERSVQLTDGYIESEKKQLIAHVVVGLEVSKDSPVINAINVAVPGAVVDTSSPEMDVYYMVSHESVIEATPKKKLREEFVRQSYEIALLSNEISDQDRENIVEITSQLTREARQIFEDKDISPTSRRQQLEMLAASSPLGHDKAIELIEFTKNNLDIYKI